MKAEMKVGFQAPFGNTLKASQMRACSQKLWSESNFTLVSTPQEDGTTMNSRDHEQ